MTTSSVGAMVTMLEGSFQGTVDTFLTEETKKVSDFSGAGLTDAEIATVAQANRKLLFGMANLGIAHFQAGTPAPAPVTTPAKVV